MLKCIFISLLLGIINSAPLPNNGIHDFKNSQILKDFVSDLKQNTKMHILEQLFDDEDNSEDKSDMDVKNNININFNKQGISQPDSLVSLMQPQQPGSIAAQQPLYQQVLHRHLGGE